MSAPIRDANGRLMASTPEDDIRALEHARVQSLLQRDMPTAWRLHAPDYQLITPSGAAWSRERYLGMVEAGTLDYLQWQAGAMQVRLRGSMAVVRYPATLQLDAGTAFRCWHRPLSTQLSHGLKVKPLVD